MGRVTAQAEQILCLGERNSRRENRYHEQIFSAVGLSGRGKKLIPNSGLDRYIFNFWYFLWGSWGRGGWAAFEAGRVSLALFFLFRSYVLFCDVERRVFLLFCALTRATAPFCFATANRRHHPPPYITHPTLSPYLN